MDEGHVGSLGALLELAHSVRGRYRSLRATVREWQDQRLARGVFSRQEWDWRGPELDEELEARAGGNVLERVARLWAAAPNRWRVEQTIGSPGEIPLGLFPVKGEAHGVLVSVADGERYRHYELRDGVASRTSGSDRLGHFLGPRRLLAGLELTIEGETEHAGRRAAQVRGVWRRRPSLGAEAGIGLLRAAEEVVLRVDLERGTLLSVVGRIDGQDFQGQEVVEVAFDETLPDELFAWEPAGVVGPRPPGSSVQRRESSTLEQVVRRARFPVFVAATVPPGAVMQVRYSIPQVPAADAGRSDEHPTGVDIYYSVPDEEAVADGLWIERRGPSWLTLTERPAAEPESERPELTRLARFSRGDVEVELWERMTWDSIIRTFRVRRDGTRIEARMEGQTLVEALEIVSSLVRAASESPPLVNEAADAR